DRIHERTRSVYERLHQPARSPQVVVQRQPHNGWRAQRGNVPVDEIESEKRQDEPGGRVLALEDVQAVCLKRRGHAKDGRYREQKRRWSFYWGSHKGTIGSSERQVKAQNHQELTFVTPGRSFVPGTRRGAASETVLFSVRPSYPPLISKQVRLVTIVLAP